SVYLVSVNDPATPVVYTLSLHDALPIWGNRMNMTLEAPAMAVSEPDFSGVDRVRVIETLSALLPPGALLYDTEDIRPYECDGLRSEEHTSELQSRENLVCRLLLEKKKKQ